ncbi:MAG: 50S ribosomal protein L25 [Patescibacteria group bacterium]
MSVFTLAAQHRYETGRKTKKLRTTGIVPCVVYGSGTEPQNISVDRNAFVKTYKEAGESSVVELSIDQKTALHVLIQDLQLDPLRDEVMHVDFRSIDMNKEIEAEVELEFVGESLAVKALGGTFVASKDSVAVKCLPSKLVRKITIDIGSLKTFEDSIRVEDIIVPEGMKIEEDLQTTLASVQAPRSEAEMEDLNKAVEMDVSAVAVEKKAKEDEAGAEKSDAAGAAVKHAAKKA